jgi:hypothetical protein
LSLKLGVNFNETEALVLDIGYLNRTFQLQQKDLESSNNFTQNMNFGCAGFRILPLYRHTKERSYFEIGPEFGWIQTSYFTDEANGPIPDNSLFQEKNIRGAIGFGAYLLGNESVSLMTGMRILYDFKDLRSEKARQESFPYQNYEDQSESYFRAIDIQFCLELNISLGFLVKKHLWQTKAIDPFVKGFRKDHNGQPFLWIPLKSHPSERNSPLFVLKLHCLHLVNRTPIGL